MYYSHLLINMGDNPDRPDWEISRRWLRNLYRVHQRLCMAFPSAERKADDPQFLKPWNPEHFCPQQNAADEPAVGAASDAPRQVHAARDERAGFMFRIDPQPGGRVVILVQSALKPDWGYAFSNAEYLLAATPQLKPLNVALSADQRLQFRLRANPTIKRDGKRLGHIHEDDQRGWLDRKAEAGGFRVLSCHVIPEGIHRLRRKPDAPAQSFLSVKYDGVLQVTDADRLLETLRNGIGSGKAFGFGLLSLAKA